MAEMMDAAQHRERGWILARQGWADLAEKEYRLALAEDPHDAATHALLALLLAEREGRGAEALEAARTAIGLAPDDALPHFAEARVHLEAERWDAAERAAREATRIDPDDPDLFAALASAHLGRRRWQEALEAAEEGLAIDPAHVGCANLRAAALVHLDRREEASAALYGALAHDPGNSLTHANQGWTHLHRGDRPAALEHFREALRLDPESDWAREGLAESLKARNPVYAGMLRYFLWMQRLQPGVRWGVIIGGVVGFRVLRRIAEAWPELAPWLLPVMVAYGAFVLLSWTAPQLFNAVLLLSRDGRDVLSEEQRESGTWVGAGFLLALAACAGAVVLRSWWISSAALLAGMLLIPLSATFKGPRGQATRGMTLFTGGLYAAAAFSVGAESQGASDVGGALFGLCLLLVAISTWVVNIREA